MSAPESIRAAWRWWLPPVAFVVVVAVAATATIVVDGTLAFAGVAGDTRKHVGALAATAAQDAAFLAVPLLLVSVMSAAGVKAYGLVPAAPKRAVALTVGLGAAFYLTTTIYSVLVGAGAEQDTLETFGVGHSTALMVAAGVLVVGAAPVAEEAFFRGFAYVALRNGLGPIYAAVMVGTVFGAIHYTGPDVLPLIPVLAVFGVLLCALYELTGSLWPSVGLHAVNNAIAFGTTADAAGAAWVGAIVGGLLLATCIGGLIGAGRWAGDVPAAQSAGS